MSFAYSSTIARDPFVKSAAFMSSLPLFSTTGQFSGSEKGTGGLLGLPWVLYGGGRERMKYVNFTCDPESRGFKNRK